MTIWLSICMLQLAKTLALTVLRELLAGDVDGSMVHAVYQTGLPERIVQDLEKASQSQLLQVSSEAVCPSFSFRKPLRDATREYLAWYRWARRVRLQLRSLHRKQPSC